MKFYVFKLSTILKVLLFITAILFSGLLLLNYNDNAVIAFKTERQIPIYSVECEDKKIAVTFDCAWGSDDIASILQTLKEHDVKATFFLVGTWAKKYPESVKMISDNGHDIANHSYTHVKMGNIDNGRIREEIIRCDKVLKDITGKQVDLFRPPYGEYNNNVVSIASQLNHYTIQWDVDSLDWTPGITPQQIQNRVLERVDKGSIILFHNDTPHTAAILSDIISSLKNGGYSIVPVSSIIMRENYQIDHTGRQKRKE